MENGFCILHSETMYHQPHCTFYTQSSRSAWVNEGIYDTEAVRFIIKEHKMSLAYTQLLELMKKVK